MGPLTLIGMFPAQTNHCLRSADGGGEQSRQGESQIWSPSDGNESWLSGPLGSPRRHRGGRRTRFNDRNIHSCLWFTASRTDTDLVLVWDWENDNRSCAAPDEEHRRDDKTKIPKVPLQQLQGKCHNLTVSMPKVWQYLLTNRTDNMVNVTIWMCIYIYIHVYMYIYSCRPTELPVNTHKCRKTGWNAIRNLLTRPSARRWTPCFTLHQQAHPIHHGLFLHLKHFSPERWI